MPNIVESPFVGGKVFDPKQELHSLTAGQEHYSYEAVEDFKHKYEFQTQGLAQLEEEIVDALEKNLRTTKETLMVMLAERSHDLGLTGEQSLLASSLIGEFMNRHAAVMDVYDRHNGDPKAIYQEVFGREAVGDVETILGPSVLYFRCHSEDDYALIYSQKFLATGQPLTEEDKRIANNSGGASIQTALSPSLQGALIAENAHGRPYDGVAREIYEHEKRHALNKFFLERGTAINRFYEMKNAKTPEERDFAMKQYLRFIRSGQESRAADELLAYSSTGNESQYILDTLTRKKADGGLYDYFADYVGSDSTGGGGQMEEFLISILGSENRQKIRDAIQQVFVDEYRRELTRGIDSIKRLTSRGYSPQEATSILGRTPLTEWTKISSRLAAERYLPREKFWLPGNKGIKVVVADSDGQFYGDVELARYNPYTGLPEYGTMRDDPAGNIDSMPVDDLKAINYPFKTPDLWYEVWMRSGGDPAVKESLNLDFTSTQEISADVAWGKFRRYCKPDSRALRVFNTYRRLLREAY